MIATVDIKNGANALLSKISTKKDTKEQSTTVTEIPSSPSHASSSDIEAEKEDEKGSKRFWLQKKKLAIAGALLALVVIIGLAVGLGVGLTRPKKTASGSNGNDKSDDGDNGSKGVNASTVAVYWGAKGDNTTLSSVCSDPSYDIVNLAFLTHFNRNGVYPRLSLSVLIGPSDAQTKAGAISLQDGTSLIPAIKKCQENGKLVLISMGGARDYADVRLSSDSQGEDTAEMIWNLFLGGTKNPELRPFGNATLDGVDFDNESDQSTGYMAMTKTFRSKFENDTSKKYYLTAAPQCPFPDDSAIIKVYQQLDYVWVQYYNNDVCNIARSGFNAAVKRWSKAIGNAKLVIGALASDADGDEGYVDHATFNKSIAEVQNMNLPNFGGAMLWDAQLASQNGDYQKNLKAMLKN
ncbi:Endochitinase 3 [Lecanicillium sp. MT-2017a]|nr:Endochitinase 3 [Lecanicillium sp. MT-2017a]